MHEAGLVRGALASALAESPNPRRLAVEVRDPVRLGSEAARFHLDALLAERGMSDVATSWSVASVACFACGVEQVPADGERFCSACGWPLPAREGMALSIRAET
jgi:hypothetical protein